MWGLGWFRRNEGKPSHAKPILAARAETFDLKDRRLLEFIRSGEVFGSTIHGALCNPSVLRCVTLISSSIGMLPLSLLDRATRKPVEDHPLAKVLHWEPNPNHTPYEFRQLMQFWLLLHGNAYARIVRSMGRIVALLPIDPTRVQVIQNDDFSLTYRVQLNTREQKIIPQNEILHLRGISSDGVTGVSIVKLANQSLAISSAAERAASRTFDNGLNLGGFIRHKKLLGDEAYARLRDSMDEFRGPNNAGRWMILEEDTAAERLSQTSAESQNLETRKHQIEEICRIFGVPRPFLMLDDTSWGSGIEQLAIMFVTSALAPWFAVWEQSIIRSCLTAGERSTYAPDFDERELLRGSMKDQAEFLAKASGSGGHRPWMTTNEIRDYVGLAPRSDGEGLVMPGAEQKEQVDELKEAA